MRDPVLHSHVEDMLPAAHALAFQQVHCAGCGALLHAANNECMQTWIETGRGNYCVPCFAKIEEVEALDPEWGLPDLEG